MSAADESTRKDGRSIEILLDIPTDAGAVWKALTDAKELEAWFPLQCRVKPGIGGAIWTSWNGAYDAEHPILAWEPGRHLRIGWAYTAQKGSVHGPMVVDFFIEGRGGQTMLRVVHSGFGSGAVWDAEFDGTYGGWHFELRGLRHYLRYHAGKARRAVFLQKRAAVKSKLQVWKELLGSAGIDAAARRSEGDRIVLAGPGGMELAGAVACDIPENTLGIALVDLNHAYMRFGMDPDSHEMKASMTATVTLSAWDVPESSLQRFEGVWKEELERVVR